MGMEARFTKLTAWALLGIILAGGCRRDQESIGPFAYPSSRPSPRENSSNAFDAYLLAAQKTLTTCNEYLGVTRYSTTDKEEIKKRLGPILRKLAEAQKNPCDFEFAPHEAFKRPREAEGWALLARAMMWGMDDSIRAKNYDAAVSTCIRATRFGFDLCGGGAIETAMGIEISNKARENIMPILSDLSASQLEKLYMGITAATLTKPSLKKVIANEEYNSMLMIDEIVERSKTPKGLDDLTSLLGEASTDGIRELEKVRGNIDKRMKFFNGFAEEAKERSAWMQKLATLSVAGREKAIFERDEARKASKVKPKLRPWKKFSQLILSTCEPLMAANDKVLARTRLFALTCYVELSKRKKGLVPGSLSAINPRLRLDPYTGRDLHYKGSGEAYKLYSNGPNIEDDGGVCSSSDRTSPDLMLEAL